MDGVVCPAGDDGRSRFDGNIREDFRRWVCHGKDDGIFVHGSNQFRSDDAGARNADDNIRTAEGIGKLSLQSLRVGHLREFLHGGVQIGRIFAENAHFIADDEVLYPACQEITRESCARCARADDDQANGFRFFAHDL